MLTLFNIICLKFGNYGIGGGYWKHNDYNPVGDNRLATIVIALVAPVAGQRGFIFLNTHAYYTSYVKN